MEKLLKVLCLTETLTLSINCDILVIEAFLTLLEGLTLQLIQAAMQLPTY